MKTWIEKILNENDFSDLYDYIFAESDAPTWLYDYYSDEMPYGIQKARDGDPGEWLNERLEEIQKEFSNILAKERIRREYLAGELGSLATKEREQKEE